MSTAFRRARAGLAIISAAALASIAAPRADAQASVALPIARAAASGDVVVPIRVSPADGVSEMEFVVQYDPAVVSPIGAFRTAFTSGHTIVPELRPPDEVRLTLQGPVLQGSGEVAWLTFRTLAAPGATSSLTWRECRLNDGLVPCNTQSGRIDVVGAAVTVQVPDDARGEPASSVSIPISATSFSGVESMDLWLAFDPSVISATSVAKTSLTAPLTLTYNVPEPGIVKISLFGTTPISGSGPLADVTFQVVGAISDSTPLDLSRALFNEGSPSTIADDGLFLVCTLVDGDGDLQSSCDGDCDDADPLVYEGAVETCDARDNDCDGWVDDAAAPSGRPSLSIAKQEAATVLSWTAVSLATGYDVVRGGLGILRQSDGDFSQATDTCLADDVASTSLTDAATPAIADGFWYLVRAVSCGGAGTYDEGAASQAMGRDAEIAAASETCP
jgi:hypothetical protein